MPTPEETPPSDGVNPPPPVAAESPNVAPATPLARDRRVWLGAGLLLVAGGVTAALSGGPTPPSAVAVARTDAGVALARVLAVAADPAARTALRATCNLDCAVVIDGQAYGPAPVTLPNAAPGRHKVRFIASTPLGQALKDLEVEAEPGKPLDVQGYFGIGTLAVNSTVPVSLVVSGKMVGKGTVQTVTLLEGRHEVVAVAKVKTLGTRKQTVVIRDGEKTELSFDFGGP